MLPRRLTTHFALTTLLLIGPAWASSSYKNAQYPSRVKNGVIEVQAPSHGDWGPRWIAVAPRDWTLVQELACGVGPVFVVKDKQGNYTIRALQWNNGGTLWTRSTAKVQPRLLSAGSFGVRFQVGKQFFSTHQGTVSGPFSK